MGTNVLAHSAFARSSTPGDALAGDIRKGKIAYVNGQKIVGTLEVPRRVESVTLTKKSGTVGVRPSTVEDGDTTVVSDSAKQIGVLTIKVNYV